MFDSTKGGFMKTMLIAAILLLTSNAQAAGINEILIEACGGIKVDYKTKEVHSIKIKVIGYERYLRDKVLKIYVDEVLLVQQLVDISVDNQGRHYRTDSFQTKSGIPTAMKLTVQRSDFEGSGILSEISFGPEVGSARLICDHIL